MWCKFGHVTFSTELTKPAADGQDLGPVEFGAGALFEEELTSHYINARGEEEEEAEEQRGHYGKGVKQIIKRIKRILP